MTTISLSMIVKNEEDVIARCLESVKDIVDEINIVDTGSTDKTKEIVKQYTDRVYHFKWIDDFGAARNYSFNKATKDYILWLDADDVLTNENREALKKLKGELKQQTDAVTMRYNLAFDQDGVVTFSSTRYRLVKRERNFQWVGKVHEYLAVGGNIYHSNIAISHHSIQHDTDRNLNIYEKRLKEGDTFTARDLYYFANELTDHKQYERANAFYTEFLATKEGWIEDNIAACGKMADNYAQLNQPDEMIQAVLHTFTYDQPRAEYCCRLGYYFFERSEFHTAIFWYQHAADAIIPKNSMGFIKEAYYTWIPHIQLCVCYDHLGEHKLAYEQNEKARKYQPQNKSILHNKQYLEHILQQSEG